MLTYFHTARAPYITQTTVFSLHTAFGQILTPRFISSNHRAWSCQHGGRRVKSVTHKRHQQYLSAQLPFKQFETWRHNGVMETVERLRLTNAGLFVPSWGGGEKTSHPSTLPPVVALRVGKGYGSGGDRGASHRVHPWPRQHCREHARSLRVPCLRQWANKPRERKTKMTWMSHTIGILRTKWEWTLTCIMRQAGGLKTMTSLVVYSLEMRGGDGVRGWPSSWSKSCPWSICTNAGGSMF